MRLLHSFGIIVISFFLNNSSLAETDSRVANGRSIGISHHFVKQDLFIFIDQKRIIKNLAKLQKTGLVDRNLSHAEVGFYEAELAAMVSIPYVAKMLQSLYSSGLQEEQIHVTSYLLTIDLYGNKTKNFCYSFNFNRDLYKKINWGSFQLNNLVKIAPDFETSHECKFIKETDPLSI